MFTGINDACAILVSSISYLWVVKTWFRVLVLVKARLGEMVVFSDGNWCFWTSPIILYSPVLPELGFLQKAQVKYWIFKQTIKFLNA